MTLLATSQSFFGSMGPEFLLIIIIGIAGFIVQARLQSVFNKYAQVPFAGGLTGKDVAEKMLRDNGITDVKVTHTPGQLTDHFNPANKTVNLSDAVYASNSVAAAAVAAHECGHAVQHAVGYAPLKMRSALVPVTSFSSRFAIFFIIGGIIMAGVSQSLVLFWIGIAMIAVSALFSVVTLPVEYDASRRALAWLEGQHILTSQQQNQAKEALMWAARTYLVAALSAIATLLYYIGLARRD
ncbi:zinc metallopeptidase [Rikenella microfusus]|uniref:Neutral zinc metallopeptidase n=1 Tax=Rikenella microfusus TaxID=28139 RepID=A0A379MTY1_9BACT|nr:zinc metallopeptidase [Rikenella microfusus]SUE35015.1 Putative neutral zinc metallopeptidase [Rikenella microfusus]HJE88881.1 zinc metallopeptidase [Rikenella microfusus]